MTQSLKNIIIESLNEYKSWVEADGDSIDLTNVDYKELERDVQEEIDEGTDKMIVDIIDHLFVQLGHKHYGIKVN